MVIDAEIPVEDADGEKLLTQDQIDKIEESWRTPKQIIKGGFKESGASKQSKVCNMVRKLALRHGQQVTLTRKRFTKDCDEGTVSHKDGDHELLNQVKMLVLLSYCLWCYDVV